MAAEVGHLDLAYDYLAEAAFMDLQDREHNTKDGLHIASLAGAWTALVGGFGGMRAGPTACSLQSPSSRRASPACRSACATGAGSCMVTVRHHGASYSLLAGDPLAISHHGSPVTVGDKVTLDIPADQAAADPSPALRPRPPAPQNHGRIQSLTPPPSPPPRRRAAPAARAAPLRPRPSRPGEA